MQNNHQDTVLCPAVYCNLTISSLAARTSPHSGFYVASFSISFTFCNVYVAHKPHRTSWRRPVNGKPATFVPVPIERNPIMCVGSLRGAAVMSVQPVNPKPCTLWSLQRCPAGSVRARKWGCRWRRQKDPAGMEKYKKNKTTKVLTLLVAHSWACAIKVLQPAWWKKKWKQWSLYGWPMIK